MKKITTSSLIILSGMSTAYIEPEGGADDVLDALKAHRDIEHTVPGGDGATSSKYVIPFHGVDMAVIYREVTDVAAPTDAICVGE